VTLRLQMWHCDYRCNIETTDVTLWL